MEILNLIETSSDGKTVHQFKTHFQLTTGDIEGVLEYIVPMLEDALTRIMASPQGLAAILAQLASGQYQRDLQANDFFDNSRILANGTGLLSLLMRNEAVIRIVSYVAAEGSQVDVVLVRRMMPYIAIHFISALAKRSNQPLCELADRFMPDTPLAQLVQGHSKQPGNGTSRLAALVRPKSPNQKASAEAKYKQGSIKDILNTLSKIELDEDMVVDRYYMK